MLYDKKMGDGEVCRITHYRCYLLNATDNIVSVDTMQTDQGEEGALHAARGMLAAVHKYAHAVEVWDRAILVGRITNGARPPDDTEPAD